MNRIIGILLLILMASRPLSAQSIISFELQKNSSLTINGSSNLLPFKIIQNGEKLLRRSLTISVSQNQDKIFLSQNRISISVKDFTSDNKMALSDFLKLLKSEIYPDLQVQFNYFEIQPKTINAPSVYGIACVNITITGVTKQYFFPVSFNRHGELYVADGKKSISIRDFGLVPPVLMMGLIKVSEWIEIDFHVTCKITSCQPSPEIFDQFFCQ